MKYSIKQPLTPAERNDLSGIPDLTAHLLFHRGVRDAEAARKFLNPDYVTGIHDPFLLKDADKAATRLIAAIKNDEKVAIYGDYDADGIPATAIFKDFFARIGFKNFVIYIPHRHNEGFGLNEDAVDQLAGEGVKLLITVDCGIADYAAVTRVNEKGMEVIITDHHEPPEILPPAFAIIDHKQKGCAYPDKNLCGSGVAFKFIQAILAKDRFGMKEGHEKWLLDLVGIATLSDMVSLTGENRVLAHYGMAVLRKGKRLGLRHLFSRLRIPQASATEDDITFMITPRINAASRMGVPMDAFDLLTAENDADAAAKAEHLDHINNERKGVVASLVKEVKKHVHERHGTRIPSVIVLGNPVWRPSLLGLVANSCAEEFHRPVFLWGRDGDNVIKGSCRSEGETHVFELMKSVPAGVFSQFGGHHHSGGFAVDNDAIHFLEQRLNESADKLPAKAEGLEGEMVDAELSLDDIDLRTHNDIAKLAPFGVGNRKPVFLFRKVSPVSVRRFGKGNEHIEIIFAKKNGQKVPAISFFGVANDWANTIEPGRALDLIASIENATFRGRSELRLRIADVVSS